jgi:hypothetical protein
MSDHPPLQNGPDSVDYYHEKYLQRLAKTQRDLPRDLNLSASKWTSGHLYLLRVIISNVKLEGKEMLASLQDRSAFQKARKHIEGNDLLGRVLSALKGSQHHLPNTHIMILLEEKGIPQAFSFFASLRDQLEPMVHYSPRAHDVDEETVDVGDDSEVKELKDGDVTGPTYAYKLLPPTATGNPIMITRGAEKRENDERERVRLEEQEPAQAQREEKERERAEQEEKERSKGRTIIANDADDLDFFGDIDFEGPSISSVISNDEETEKEREKDEFVTTKTVDVFITLIFTLFYRFGNDASIKLNNNRKLIPISPDSRQSYRHFSLGQMFYKVKTVFGNFNSKTDGGVYEARWGEGKCRRPDDPDTVPNIVDMEAKAAGISLPLPQHAAELIAHIYTRLKLIYNSDDPKLSKFKSYYILSVAQRTAHLFCFHQTNFRVVWAKFTPEYLAFLFGPPAQAFMAGDSALSREQPIGMNKSQPKKPVLQLFASEEMPMIFAGTRRKAACAILALGIYNQNYGEIARSL